VTLVCDSCGHVAPHDQDPQFIPFQPKGTTAFVDGGLQVAECRRSDCFCNRAVWRDLLPSEPAL